VISASRIMQRCEALARHSEQPGGLTRVFLSPESRAAGERVLGWMREAGMTAKLDAIGNIVGRYEGEGTGLPCLLLGSHLDTVRNAGKYDGMLGVVSAIECVHALHAQGRRLPFAVEVIGFADEEGVRFGTTLLGSRAVAGNLDLSLLRVTDSQGKSLEAALREFGLDPARLGEAAKSKKDVLAYVELHIEQGPVLEAEGLPVGVVTAINGFSRVRCVLRGEAGHAGTVPMRLRRDALAGAAECALAVERIAQAGSDIVATVGRIEALPGAINVIPGEVMFTVDVRAPQDAAREAAVAAIRDELGRIAKRRLLGLEVEMLQSQGVALCAQWLMRKLERAVAEEGMRVFRLPSGAGHDGMAIQAIADIAMLFVRCKAGISHNPAEAITEADAEAGARVLARFIGAFAPQER
jgi:allantoate deiminase